MESATGFDLPSGKRYQVVHEFIKVGMSQLNHVLLLTKPLRPSHDFFNDEEYLPGAKGISSAQRSGNLLGRR